MQEFHPLPFQKRGVLRILRLRTKERKGVFVDDFANPLSGMMDGLAWHGMVLAFGAWKEGD